MIAMKWSWKARRIMIFMLACATESEGVVGWTWTRRFATTCPADFDLRGVGKSRYKCSGSKFFFRFQNRKHADNSAAGPSPRSNTAQDSSVALCLIGKRLPPHDDNPTLHRQARPLYKRARRNMKSCCDPAARCRQQFQIGDAMNAEVFEW